MVSVSGRDHIMADSSHEKVYRNNQSHCQETRELGGDWLRLLITLLKGHTTIPSEGRTPGA